MTNPSQTAGNHQRSPPKYANGMRTTSPMAMANGSFAIAWNTLLAFSWTTVHIFE
jgi:hypothetical protein